MMMMMMMMMIGYTYVPNCHSMIVGSKYSLHYILCTLCMCGGGGGGVGW